MTAFINYDFCEKALSNCVYTKKSPKPNEKEIIPNQILSHDTPKFS